MTNGVNHINPHKVSGRILFFIILALFIIGAFVFTGSNHFTEHDAVADIDGFLNGFQSLAYGDVEGFFAGIIAGIPVIAMFMVLFALLHFLTTVILKSIFSKRVGTVFALVVSLYGFIDHRIFNYMLSLNAYTVGFLVFCALIIMLWGFGKHGVKGLKSEWKEGSQIKKNSAPTKDEIKRLKKLIADMNKESGEK